MSEYLKRPAENLTRLPTRPLDNRKGKASAGADLRRLDAIVDRNYIRIHQPPLPCQVGLTGLYPPPPTTVEPRLSMGAKAWGLDLTSWPPGLVLAWYKSRTGGSWIALVESEVKTSNNLHTVKVRQLVPANWVRKGPGL